MSSRWNGNGENNVAEYKDVQASTMAIDCTGQFAVLAGRRNIALVNLDQLSVPVRKVQRSSKWEVGAAQWNPQQPHIFALSCNQRAEIFEWKESELKQVHLLKQHTRAISDLDWSSFDSCMLATSSIDTFVYLWDIRDTRRPAVSLSAVAGATQVQWNKVSPDILATSHEGDIRLWDRRKVSTPVSYISAHISKIHGIDWSPHNEHHLATSSQDCMVKFWDTKNPKRFENVLQSMFPVWRARYTPFGDGLVTVVVPQLRRGENSLVLWNVTSLETPVHTFIGHTEVVLEFAWRKQREDLKEFQLVTWSKDHSLRLWTIDQQLQKLCGYDGTADSDETEVVSPTFLGQVDSQDGLETSSQGSTTRGEVTPPQIELSTEGEEREPSTPSPSPMQPHNLEKEFSLVNINIPNVTIDEMDSTKRTCTVTVVNGKSKVQLSMTFPNAYPYNAAPTFNFARRTCIEKTVKAKLTKVLKMTSQQQVRRNKSCLEPCIRQLVSTLETCTTEAAEQNELLSPFGSEVPVIPSSFLSPPVYGSFQDASVPFPRTSGARFCGADYLVCFVRPPHLQKINAPTEVTPRSLSALGAYISAHLLPIQQRLQRVTGVGTTSSSAHSQGSGGSNSTSSKFHYSPMASQSPTGDPSVSISSFYYKDRKHRGRSHHSHHRQGHQQHSTHRHSNSTGQDKKLGGSGSQKPLSNSGAIVIYSIAKLTLVNQTLAQNYVFSDDVPSMCNKNASVAALVRRKDLVQIWSLAALSAAPQLRPPLDPDSDLPWAQHPLGRKLLQSMINHCMQHLDVQTVAMLCCAFGSQTKETLPWNRKNTVELSTGSPGGSPYHTVVPADTQFAGWSVVGSSLKRNRSNSWSDSVEEFRNSEYFQDPKELEKEQHEANINLYLCLVCDEISMKKGFDELDIKALNQTSIINPKMLDPKCMVQYDQFRKVYAEILYRWNLLEQRAQVLKFISTPPERHKGIEFLNVCHLCENEVRGAQCGHCRGHSFCCAICRVAVRGSSNFCLSCGHGGHSLHMQDWFKKYDCCPTGCGCQCLEESNKIFGH